MTLSAVRTPTGVGLASRARLGGASSAVLGRRGGTLPARASSPGRRACVAGPLTTRVKERTPQKTLSWLLSRKLSPFAPAFFKSLGDGITAALSFEAVHAFGVLSSLGGRIGFAKVLSELMAGRLGGYQPMVVTDHLVGAAGWFTSYLFLVTMSQKLERGAARSQGEEKNASSLVFVGSPSVLQFEDGAVKSPESPPAKPAPPRVLGGGRPAALPAPPPGSDVSLSNEARGKALRDRQAYLKNFWYAAALSDSVRDQPVAAQLLGLKLVLFRDELGAVHCLQDACPHRGAPLSTGWVSRPKDGRPSAVVCGYHGWAFDGRGVLREVPANSAGETLPQRPLLESFHVTEQAGFVWLFYGDKNLAPDARPPLPLIPEFASPDWHPVYGEFEFDAPHGAVFENAIDFAHIHYLHNSSFGNQEAPQVRDMRASSGPFGVDTSFRIQNKPVNALWEWSRVPEVLVHAKALLPSTSVVGFTLSHGVSMITFVNTVPIGPNKSVNRFALLRNFATRVGPLQPLVDGYARNAMFGIMAEDKAMVETLRPELVAQEFNVRADLAQLEYRKLRQSWIDMGYGIAPPEEMEADFKAARAACNLGCLLPEESDE